MTIYSVQRRRTSLDNCDLFLLIAFKRQPIYAGRVNFTQLYNYQEAPGHRRQGLIGVPTGVLMAALQIRRRCSRGRFAAKLPSHPLPPPPLDGE